MPTALWKAGRQWSRTYMVAKTASTKNFIHQTLTPLRQLRVGAHQQRERFAVAELVIAPVFEPFEDRMKATLRVLRRAADRS